MDGPRTVQRQRRAVRVARLIGGDLLEQCSAARVVQEGYNAGGQRQRDGHADERNVREAGRDVRTARRQQGAAIELATAADATERRSNCGGGHPLVLHVAHVAAAAAKVEVLLGRQRGVDALGLVADDVVGEAALHADSGGAGHVVGGPQHEAVVVLVMLGRLALDFLVLAVLRNGSIVALAFERRDGGDY